MKAARVEGTLRMCGHGCRTARAVVDWVLAPLISRVSSLFLLQNLRDHFFVIGIEPWNL
ncbi:hypothetical protein CsSME_00034945 [Camellia sinensis var. sinensis]